MTSSIGQKFETVIGLEVHLQLNTKTKIFCGCANLFGAEPNSLTCPVCLGLPGTLPVLNKAALLSAIKVALALNCSVNPRVKFDRKNYYYPDLPKGYQISQYDLPIAEHGFVMIPVPEGTKKINVKRAHLEEDAGKLVHDMVAHSSLVDYNRTGTPLIEIVTEPDLRSSQEAYDYLNILKLTLQYLNVSDCDMEKGSLRCDANISLREKGSTQLGTKTELKNLNSFSAVKASLEFEVHRQEQLLLAGERIVQETRLWNDEKQMTLSMRSKEEAHDYRYFPEPDLVPFTIDQATIEKVRESLPELPAAKFDRLRKQYQLSDYDAGIIIQDQTIADFFEKCTQHSQEIKKICNWIIGPLLQEINSRKTGLAELSLKPQDLTTLIQRVEEGALSNLSAKEVFALMVETGQTPDAIIKDKGLAQVSDDSALEGIVQSVIGENQSVVEQIKQGKDSAIGFLVGQAMKKSQGKGNPKKFGELIKRRLQDW